MNLFLTPTKSTAETECCACEPGGLVSAFLRTRGSALQSHLISSLQPTAAAGGVVQNGHHSVSSLIHPNPSGLGAAMADYNVVLIVRTGMFFGIPVMALMNLRML